MSPFTPTNLSNYYDDFDFSAPSGGGNSSSVARSWQRRRRLQKPKQNNHDVRVVSCSGVPFDRLPGECVRNSESHLPAETEYDNLADIEPVDDADRGAGHVEVADERDAGEDDAPQSMGLV